MEKGLSRAHSELSIDGAGSDMKSDKSGRKSRRFSDIFRYGVLRPATSCDNLKLAMKSSSGDGCFKCPDELADVVLRKKDAKNMFNSNRRESAPNVAVDNKHSESKSNKVESKKGGKEKEEESYLKRVKSRIYKNRNDNSNTTVISTMPDIAEHTTSSSKKSKKKKGQQSKEKEEGAVFKVRRDFADFLN